MLIFSFIFESLASVFVIVDDVDDVVDIINDVFWKWSYQNIASPTPFVTHTSTPHF